jgi:hypothetical protein
MNKPIYEIDEFGVKQWRLNGEWHREDGPAIEYPDGTKHWFFNGWCLNHLVVVDDPYYRKEYPELVE